MTIPNLIGVMGRSRVGKDTVANVLCEVIGSECTTIHRISKTLKEAVCALYGYEPHEVDGPSKEQLDARYGISPRSATQGLCDYMMQRHGSDFFSKQAFQTYDRGEFGNKYVIIPDIRYEHDMYEIHQRNGIIIKVVRRTGSACHPWEAHIDKLKGDYTIMNEGSLNNLQHSVKSVFFSADR